MNFCDNIPSTIFSMYVKKWCLKICLLSEWTKFKLNWAEGYREGFGFPKVVPWHVIKFLISHGEDGFPFRSLPLMCDVENLTIKCNTKQLYKMSFYQIIKGCLKNEIILYHFWKTCCLKKKYMLTHFWEELCLKNENMLTYF